MRIMMAAGEASGDLHGSHLAREILRLHPEARIYGMGGPLMAQAGVDVLYDPTQKSAMGFTESLKSIRPLNRILNQLTMLLAEDEPDVFVAIDFPSFNLKLARRARLLQRPTVYYFSPSAWAWGAKRAELIANLGVTVCSIFPFEADFYRKAGAKVVYVGHPLLDIAKAETSRTDACQALGLDPARPVLGLLPGSREQELKSLLPPMLEAFRQLRGEDPDLQGILPAAHTTSASLLRELLGDAQVHTVSGQTHDTLMAANAAIVASGTATLEAAILGTPQAVVYRMSNLSYRIAKRIVKIPHVSLPNIVAEKEIVPELLQDAVRGPIIADAVRPLLKDPDASGRMRAEYAKVVERLGRSGAIERAANVVLAVGRDDPDGPEQFALREDLLCEST